MDHFHLVEGVFHCEEVPLPIIAETVGAPVYVRSVATMERHARVCREAVSQSGDPLIAFCGRQIAGLAAAFLALEFGGGGRPHARPPLRAMRGGDDRHLATAIPHRSALPGKNRRCARESLAPTSDKLRSSGLPAFATFRNFRARAYID